MAASYHSFKEVVEVIQESNKHLEKMSDSMEVLKTSVATALTSIAGVLSSPASSIPAPVSIGGAGKKASDSRIAGGSASSSSMGSMPSFDLGNTLGSLGKGASLNVILKVFPKLLSNAKSGFKKLGSAVKVLDDKSFKNGADNLKTLTDALTSFYELDYAKLYIATKFFPFFIKSIQKMSKGLDANAIKKDLEPLGEVSQLLAGKDASEGIKETNGILGKLVKVLTDFAEVNWKSIIGSTVGLVLFAKGMSKAGKMMSNPATVEGINAMSPTLDSLIGVSEKLSKLKKMGTSIGKALTAAFGLVLLAKVFSKAGDMLKNPAIVEGIQALNPVIDAMTGMAENLKKMGNSFAKAVGAFFESLGKQLGKIAKGALAISLMAGALFLSAKAFGAFSDVAWTDVLTGIVALGALTVAAIALGTVMESGVGAVAIFLGAAAIAALGVALIPAAYAMQMAGEGMKLMGDGLTQIVPQLSELAAVAPMLYATAGAIGAVSAALALFGAGQAVAGITSLFGKLTGSSPVEQLKELAGLGDGLQKTADSLDRIRGANSTLASNQLSGAVTAADVTESTAKIETAAMAQGSADRGAIVNAPRTSMTNNNNTFVSSSWVPDRTSLFVLARA
jgi:hypothetical protein